MFLCALLALIPFLRGKALLHFCKPRFSGQMVRQVVACGSPNFLNNIAGRITSILMNWILVRLGGEMAVSVYGILMYAEGFIQPLLYGMCDSLQPAVGYNWGAGKFSRVRAIEKCCFCASGIVSIGAVFLIALLPEQIARLFMADAGGEMLEVAVGALLLAIEKPVAASLISVSTALLFPVLLVLLLQPLGLTGIWLNFAGTAALAALLSGGILWKMRRELSRPDLD